jgi:hypothetical protein
LKGLRGRFNTSADRYAAKGKPENLFSRYSIKEIGSNPCQAHKHRVQRDGYYKIQIPCLIAGHIEKPVPDCASPAGSQAIPAQSAGYSGPQIFYFFSTESIIPAAGAAFHTVVALFTDVQPERG